MKFSAGDNVIYLENKQEGKVVEVDETHAKVQWDGDLFPQWSSNEKVELISIYFSPLYKAIS